MDKNSRNGTIFIYPSCWYHFELIKTEKIKLFKIENAIMPTDEKCPRCSSDALYKFGKTQNGKQRYRCQVCNRQFVLGKSRLEVKNRPACPRCGKQMHIYMRADNFIRFRCSEYPASRTFYKITTAEPLFHQLLHS